MSQEVNQGYTIIGKSPCSLHATEGYENLISQYFTDQSNRINRFLNQKQVRFHYQDSLYELLTVLERINLVESPIQSEKGWYLYSKIDITWLCLLHLLTKKFGYSFAQLVAIKKNLATWSEAGYCDKNGYELLEFIFSRIIVHGDSVNMLIFKDGEIIFVISNVYKPLRFDNHICVNINKLLEEIYPTSNFSWPEEIERDEIAIEELEMILILRTGQFKEINIVSLEGKIERLDATELLSREIDIDKLEKLYPNQEIIIRTVDGKTIPIKRKIFVKNLKRVFRNFSLDDSEDLGKNHKIFIDYLLQSRLDKFLYHSDEINEILSIKTVRLAAKSGLESMFAQYISMGLVDVDLSDKEERLAFSTIDMIWINIIGHLSAFGFTLEKIKRVKDNLANLVSFEEGTSRKSGYETLGFWFLMIVGTRSPVSVVVFENCEILVFSERERLLTLSEGMFDHYLHINLNAIVQSVYGESDLDLSPIYNVDFELSDEELEIIMMLRTGSYKSITLITNKGKIERYEALEVKKNSENISKLLNEEDFQDIYLQKRNGQVRHIKRTVLKKFIKGTQP